MSSRKINRKKEKQSLVLNLVPQESKQYSLMKIITRCFWRSQGGRIVWKMESGPTALMTSQGTQGQLSETGI